MPVDYSTEVTKAFAKAVEVLLSPEFTIGEWIVDVAEDADFGSPVLSPNEGKR